jgi:hypothetical protein
MAFAINSRGETLPDSLTKGVKISKEELNKICGKVHESPEVFDESELRKAENKGRVMQVIWKDATGFEAAADGKTHTAKFQGIEQRMDKDCAIFEFIESLDDRKSDQPYFIPLDKIQAGDIKVTVEFLLDPNALFSEWLKEHGTQKRPRPVVKQEGGETSKSSTRGGGSGK